ncbi:transcriptional regulator STERILE APETALA [Cajanus cajan]|uniref:Transcriptional regulator STERILE APETALA n=1 Tax=Cajanus cajan TaxID=3821 RepID=A0A151U2H4_CAJCA|nr:transcriptional regulator STERILE APETALA [Cajanus cajan]KYP73529.1 Transcriptional regulator STERILE APETALA [Cajanus cajan]
MSSTTSSSSSSSTSTPYDAVAADVPGPSTRRTGQFEAAGPSSSRQRAMNEVLPEPILEALATQVAVDAAQNNGRLSAASALAILFQVCSTWREVSRSDLLWQRLTRRIWRRSYRLRATWQLEFIYWHRTARNFATGNLSSNVPQFDPAEQHQSLICRCLALSDTHLACGFVDGTVRLFDLETLAHVSTYVSAHGHLFGAFSRSISGIVMVNSVITFARLDGDVYVDFINGPGPSQARRAVSGDVVINGVLVGFAGTARWWVGLYAGIADRAFQIWDARSEERVFMRGSLTNPETVMGWHMLTELVEPVGRVRVAEREYVVACTGSRLVCFNFRNPDVLLSNVRSTAGFVVGSLDSSHEAFVVVERSGLGTVRHASSFQRLSRFRVRGSVQGLLGCMNLGYVLTYSPGPGPGPGPLLRVWDIERAVGRLCVTLGFDAGEANSMVANERHVAISGNDNSINLLDFGVQDP